MSGRRREAKSFEWYDRMQSIAAANSSSLQQRESTSGDALPSMSLEMLPLDLILSISDYLTQSSRFALYRTSKTFWHALGPQIWKKISLAPNPAWVRKKWFGEVESSDEFMPGTVYRGFHRTSRLLDSFDLVHQDDQFVHSKFCRELVICEVLFDDQMENLFLLFNNVRKVKLYMGHYLRYNKFEVSGADSGFRITRNIQNHATKEREGVRESEPCTLFESVWMGLNYGISGWSAKFVTHLEIDVEPFLAEWKAISSLARERFGWDSWEWLRHHNFPAFAFYECFPNIQQLTCHSWFLELLLDYTLLAPWTLDERHGRYSYHLTGPDRQRMNEKFGVTGWNNPFWKSLISVYITKFDEDYTDGIYSVHNSIMTHRLWSFLGSFRSLKTIRCGEGSWDVLQRYPGGFSYGRRVESLVALAACYLCHVRRGWDVHLGEFDVNLAHIEVLTNKWDPAEDTCPPTPHMDSLGELSLLFDWLCEIGWSGFMRMIDTTNWWDGPTYPFWNKDAEAPETHQSLATLYDGLDTGVDGRKYRNGWLRHVWLPEEIMALDPDDPNYEGTPHCDVKTILNQYIVIRKSMMNWMPAGRSGLDFHFETCWSKSLWDREIRHKSTAMYDARPMKHIGTELISDVGRIAFTTDRYHVNEHWLKCFDEHLTVLNIDGLEVVLDSDDGYDDDGKCSYLVRKTYATSQDWDFWRLGYRNLQRMSVTNFDILFDPDRDSSTPGMEKLPMEDVGFGSMWDFPMHRKLEKLQLQGTVFFIVSEKRAKDLETLNRQELMETFYQRSQQPEVCREKLDTRWLRFAYLRGTVEEVAKEAGGDPKKAIIAFPRHYPPGIVYRNNKYKAEKMKDKDPEPLSHYAILAEFDTYDIVNQWKDVEAKEWRLWSDRNVAIYIQDFPPKFFDIAGTNDKIWMWPAFFYSADGVNASDPATGTWIARPGDNLLLAITFPTERDLEKKHYFFASASW